MKKCFIIYILVLFLASANSLYAKENEPAKQPQTGLDQIILDTNREFVSAQTQTASANGDTAVNLEQNAPTENSPECCKRKRFKFFVFLNPFRPIEKTQYGVEKCATCVNKNVDNQLHKLDKTPLKVIPKTDKIIDTGVEKTDTSIRNFWAIWIKEPTSA